MKYLNEIIFKKKEKYDLNLIIIFEKNFVTNLKDHLMYEKVKDSPLNLFSIVIHKKDVYEISKCIKRKKEYKIERNKMNKKNGIYRNQKINYKKIKYNYKKAYR